MAAATVNNDGESPLMIRKGKHSFLRNVSTLALIVQYQRKNGTVIISGNPPCVTPAEALR